jgi:hypothetical protein
MQSKKSLSILALAVGAAMVASLLAPAPVEARDLAGMSCEGLWYARNKIYARNGYCFRTERARAVFGRGCFPPYGRLRGWERERVNRIQMWEGRKGC